MNSGLYTGISEKEYSKIDALRSSDLKLLLRSPAHYRAEKDGFGPPITTQKQKAFDVGDAFHAALLEPDRFQKNFTLMPEFSGKESVAAKKEWLEKNADKISLTEKDYQAINNMKVAVRNHPEASQLLNEKGLSEVTGYFIDSEYEIPCKIRIDRLNKLRGIPIDIKTSGVDVAKSSWTRRSYDLKYHLSAWFYCHGLSIITQKEYPQFITIAVEKDYPNPVMVYEMAEDVIAYGGADVAHAMKIYKECLEKNEWPCYPTGVHLLGLPKYAKPASSSFFE